MSAKIIAALTDAALDINEKSFAYFHNIEDYVKRPGALQRLQNAVEEFVAFTSNLNLLIVYGAARDDANTRREFTTTLRAVLLNLDYYEKIIKVPAFREKLQNIRKLAKAYMSKTGGTVIQSVLRVLYKDLQASGGEIPEALPRETLKLTRGDWIAGQQARSYADKIIAQAKNSAVELLEPAELRKHLCAAVELVEHELAEFNSKLRDYMRAHSDRYEVLQRKLVEHDNARIANAALLVQLVQIDGEIVRKHAEQPINKLLDKFEDNPRIELLSDIAQHLRSACVPELPDVLQKKISADEIIAQLPEMQNYESACIEYAQHLLHAITLWRELIGPRTDTCIMHFVRAGVVPELHMLD